MYTVYAGNHDNNIVQVDPMWSFNKSLVPNSNSNQNKASLVHINHVAKLDSIIFSLVRMIASETASLLSWYILCYGHVNGHKYQPAFQFNYDAKSSLKSHPFLPSSLPSLTVILMFCIFLYIQMTVVQNLEVGLPITIKRLVIINVWSELPMVKGKLVMW